MDVLPLILNVLHERYDIAIESVTPETTLESLDVDSLGLVELMFEVEDRLGIPAPKDFETPVTVADLVKIVQTMREASLGQPA
ncbi:MAG: acyl carrier protein [Parasulfuritortus sp.]|nr:acyl carrier protein [Parasulfuritortus sp.]